MDKNKQNLYSYIFYIFYILYYHLQPIIVFTCEMSGAGVCFCQIDETFWRMCPAV